MSELTFQYVVAAFDLLGVVVVAVSLTLVIGLQFLS